MTTNQKGNESQRMSLNWTRENRSGIIKSIKDCEEFVNYLMIYPSIKTPAEYSLVKL